MALNASIDLTVKKPDFKSMKSEIKELTIAAQQAVMQFGEFSPEAQRAEQALANARDRMDDFNDRVKAVNPDKFAQINTVVQGVARGFQAAQGAMALFGSESKDLEKTMVKLQGAMALAEGLEGLGKIQQQFTAIFDGVVSGAKKAFAAIKAGIGSTGIGLIVVALGSIVAYWDEIKYAIMGVSEETKKAKAEQDAYNKSIKELNAEREVLLYGELAGKKSQLRDIESEQNQLAENYIKIQKQLKIIEQARALSGIHADEEREKMLRKALRDNQLRSEQLVNEEIKTRSAIRTIEEQDEAKKQAKQDAINAKRTAQNEKNKSDAEKEYERQVALIESIYAIRKQGIEKEAKLRDDFARKQEENAIKLEENAYQRQYSKQEQLTLFIKANHAELIQAAIGYFNTIAELADAFAGRDEESQKRAFEIGKAMRYASTVLSTIEGTQNAFTTAEKSPITAAFPGYPFAQATAAALFGVAQLAKIKKTKFNSTSSPTAGQMSGAGIPQMSAPKISSSLPTVGQFDTKVFVTEGDIRRTTDRVDTTRKVSVVK